MVYEFHDWEYHVDQDMTLQKKLEIVNSNLGYWLYDSKA